MADVQPQWMERPPVAGFFFSLSLYAATFHHIYFASTSWPSGWLGMCVCATSSCTCRPSIYYPYLKKCCPAVDTGSQPVSMIYIWHLRRLFFFFFLSINISRDRNSEPEIHFNSRTQCVVARKYPNPHIYIGRIDFWRLQMASAATFSFTNKIADGANLLFSFMLHYAVDFVGSKRFIIGWKTAHLLALKK